jgi:phosphonate transport system permease protein
VRADAIRASILTFDTALLGTAGALVLSLLLVPLAARNLTPHRAAYEGARLVIGVTRAIPDFVFALIFLVAVGLGAYAVVLAVAAHSVGVLGKLFAEAVEDMDMGPVDALRAAGASRLQVFVHAVVPGVAATLTGLALYRLDTNVRSVLYLGAIGGGGLGFMLYNSLQLFQYPQATTELAVLLVLLLVVERASLVVRQRIR